MENEIKKITSVEYFSKRYKEVVKKVGSKQLNNDDIFILMCKKLFISYTYEEKKYMTEYTDKD